MKFGQSVDVEGSKAFADIDKIIKRSNPNYLPFVLSKIISRYEKQLDVFKRFIPVSKNPELENAMTDAVSNFHKLFDKKTIDYRSLYFKALNKLNPGSGAQIYNADIIVSPMQNSVRGIQLWQE